MNFVKACNVADVQPGGVVQASGGSELIAVFNVNGRFFATQDSCPHGQWPLSESYVDGDTVECALHNGRFSICSGKRLSPPVCRALRTYVVRVEAGIVYVDVDSGAYELRPGAADELAEAHVRGRDGLG